LARREVAKLDLHVAQLGWARLRGGQKGKENRKTRVKKETAPEPDPVATRHDAGGFTMKTDLHWRKIGRLVPDEGSA
jgi:hypothetical protein